MPCRFVSRAVRALALLAATALLPHPAAATCELSKVTTVKLTIEGSRLYVPVSINETEGQFILDTGSELTMLNADFADQAHVGLSTYAGQVSMTGLGGRSSLPVNQAHARTTEVGTIKFPDWLYPVLPREMVAKDKTERQGLLGMDFLHYFDMDMDLQAGTLTLWRVTGCTDIHPEWQGDYDAIPLKHTVRQSVTMPIFVDDAFLDVVFDTGADGAWLTRDAAARAGVTDEMLAKDKSDNGAGVGGEVAAAAHLFKLLLIGSGEFPNARITVETKRRQSFYSDGLVDWRFLRARKIWISYPTNTLFVQKIAK